MHAMNRLGDDASIDSIVITYTLCTIGDAAAALPPKPAAMEQALRINQGRDGARS